MRSRVALADQVRQVAAVVDVGVAEDDGVERGGGEGEVDVGTAAFLAEAGGAAVEQDALAAGLDQVHGTTDSLGGAEEGHGGAARGWNNHTPIIPAAPVS